MCSCINQSAMPKHLVHGAIHFISHLCGLCRVGGKQLSHLPQASRWQAKPRLQQQARPLYVASCCSAGPQCPSQTFLCCEQVGTSSSVCGPSSTCVSRQHLLLHRPCKQGQVSSILWGLGTIQGSSRCGTSYHFHCGADAEACLCKPVRMLRGLQGGLNAGRP
jgi:hypothetical protein